MAKTKRRTNRKLKRSVRRTLGALCMITAIIVAAIPFPDARANTMPIADSDYEYASDLINDITSDEGISFINGTVTKTDDGSGNVKTTPKNGETIRKAYIVPTGNDAYLNWQFEYFVPSGKDNAVILSYNEEYTSPDNVVSIAGTVYSDYLKIDEDQYKNFVDATTKDFSLSITLDSGETKTLKGYGGSQERTITFNKATSGAVTITGDDYWFFEKYFPDQLESIRESVDNEKYTSPYDWVVKPSRDINDDSLKYQYFCDCLFSPQTVGSNTKTELVAMKTKSYDEAGNYIGDKRAYIPRTSATDGTLSTTLQFSVDNQGYLCAGEFTINGVAPYAFAGVSNVKELSFDTSIKYIGDGAFYECTQMLEKVILAEGTSIGNRAFYNCPKLTEVELPGGISTIGAEAFYNCGLVDLSLPSDLKTIGDGAFAECTSLKTITYQGAKTTESTIGDYAFFDCTALDAVKFGNAQIKQIGQSAFAVIKSVTGNLTSFNFPNDIVDGFNLGKYVLAGRTNLETVVMPSNLGYQKKTEIPNDVFYKCANLKCVEFQKNSGLVTFESDIFNTIVNNSFYVKGPKFQLDNATVAMPREATWDATFFNGEKHVPYMYEDEDGKDYYEISDGKFVSVVDKTGKLVSCSLVKTSSEPIVLTLSQVGDIPISSFGENCFTREIIKNLEKLDLSEASVSQIDDYVFAGAVNLKEVILGDSITSIGEGSFQNCYNLESVVIGGGISNIGKGAFQNILPSNIDGVSYPTETPIKLKYIKFNTPINGTDSFTIENIGDYAFSAGSKNLVIEGEVAPNYAPFAWAMNSDNYLDEVNGIRVCYKTPLPSDLTIILDNSNNLPTLIDYPHYGELESAVKSAYEDNAGLTPEMEAQVNACLKIKVPEGVESIDSYGYLNSSSYNFGEQLDGYTSNDNNIRAYFSGSGLEYTVNGVTKTTKIDESLLKAYGQGPSSSSGEDIEHQGLFSGNLIDNCETNNDYRINGNDYLEEIKLNSVKYLPAYCFDSCENLKSADLGSAIELLGDLPFTECNNIESVGFGTSAKYAYNYGIIYENLTDGSTNIVECLPSVGNAIGADFGIVDGISNPELSKVTSISDGAFSNCPYITEVDLSSATGLKIIPDSCFENSKALETITLPEGIISIESEAFNDITDKLTVVLKSPNTSLADDAFDSNNKATLYLPEGNLASVSALKQDVKVKYASTWIVRYNFSASEYVKEVVEDGKRAYGPDSSVIEKNTPKGMKFVGWTDADKLLCVTEDLEVSAIFEEDPTNNGNGSGDNSGDDGNNGGFGGNGGIGNNGSTGNNGNTGGTSSDKDDDDDDDDDDKKKHTLTVVYGNGSGTYKKGATVIISAIEPPAGKEFYKWTTTNTGLTITSATSAATTVKMTDSDATVTATYRDKSSVSGNSSKPISKKENPATEVQITKPGISSTDKAYASVKGSTDNFVVKITESAEAASAVATALAYEYADMEPIKYFAMDISLYDKKGNKVTNTNGLSVDITMPIPDQLVQYGGNNKVGAVVNNSTLEKLNCKFTTVSGVPCVTFTATHFSPYTIYVDTSNLSANVIDSSPKTGDGIHPKWFLSLGLACLSIVLFMKKDKVTSRKVVA